MIPRRHLLPLLQQLLNPAHLHPADRGSQLVDAVVIAEVGVVEPGIARSTSLVAQCTQHFRPVIPVGDDHRPLTGRDLLVGIERKDTGIAFKPGRPAFVLRSKGFTGILNQVQPMPLHRRFDSVIISHLTENIYGQDRFQPLSILRTLPGKPPGRRLSARSQIVSCLGHLCRVQVAAHRIHIHKNRHRPFKQDHICGRDKRERRGDDKVALMDPGSTHQHVEPART